MVDPAALRVESPEENAAIARAVLAGDAGPPRDMVLANAAAGLFIMERVPSLVERVATAAAALDDGRARALEPMGSADRKVIHDTVSEIDGVEPESEGSDRDRRVVIRPVAD